MKTKNIIRLHVEVKTGRNILIGSKLLRFFNNLIIIAFTRWGKSNLTGATGAATLLQGQSTFGSTGRLYSLQPAPAPQPAIPYIYWNRRVHASTTTYKACTTHSFMYSTN